MADLACEMHERNGFTSKDLALVVPHRRANLRIIRAMQERLGVDDSKIMVNIEALWKYDRGNDSLWVLRDAVEEGRLKKGRPPVLLKSRLEQGYTAGSIPNSLELIRAACDDDHPVGRSYIPRIWGRAKPYSAPCVLIHTKNRYVA